MTNDVQSASAPPDRIPLPPRYHEVWGDPFFAAIDERMRPGVSVLDVGAGRFPTLTPERRPADTTYVGLDLSAEELRAAEPGVYDETVASDASTLRDELVGRFDVIVSWQVLEHVQDVGAAMVCSKAYLRPGGRLVAMFSGSWSAFAIINRLLPYALAEPVVTRVMGRTSARPVFPAYYDRCEPAPLRRMLHDWSAVRIVPFYYGARYFNFSALATRAYVGYENLLVARRLERLATHYLLVADR